MTMTNELLTKIDGLMNSLIVGNIPFKQGIADLQELIWNEKANVGTPETDVIYRDLAHDLDYYESDPRYTYLPFFDENQARLLLQTAIDSLAKLAE